MGTKEKSLQDKLKVFFKKGSSAPVPARNELIVTPELERELGPDTPLPRRLRAMKDVGDRAILVRVQEGGVEKLWSCTRDLLEESACEARHGALALLCALAEGQADQLQLMRAIYFRYLRDAPPALAADDGPLRVKLLHTLTNAGRNVSGFEEEIGMVLVRWVGARGAPAADLLALLTNVVKFNATYLDQHVVHAVIQCACEVCVYSAEAGAVREALALLEAVVSYSLVPRAALPALVHALCRTVNADTYCHTSWKLMRDVMGADIGHAALQELVAAARTAGADAGLVRGAVFYTSMALWGPRRVPALKVSFLTVLPAFLKALQGEHAVVTYEVAAGLASGLERAHRDLTPPAWDAVLRVLAALLRQDQATEPRNEAIHERVHALITTVERMADDGTYCGDHDQLLELVDSAGHERPEESTMRLVRLRAGALSPVGSEWAAAAQALAERYLRREPRLGVRLHTLDQLLGFVRRHRLAYGCEVVEAVGVPLLGACAADGAAEVREAAARALAELARDGPPDAATDLVDLLEKILDRPFAAPADASLPPDAGADARAAAAGLRAVAVARMLAAPGALPARCLLVLLDHLDRHYKRPAVFKHHPDIRAEIFEVLFSLRANAFNCVGLCYDAAGEVVGGAESLHLRPVCSPHLVVEPAGARTPAPAREPPPGACVLPVGRMARAVAGALAGEASWPVLERVLRALPALLWARAPALGRRAADVELVAGALCALLAEGGRRAGAAELAAAALPALSALAPRHGALEAGTLRRAVRCLLRAGPAPRAPRPQLQALALFALEARDTMVRMLPEVLLALSKVSDTAAMAAPMLEFLSTLTRLPAVFASFVEDQYMSVFAIVLPYTNPARYNHYVVSLAHHVIAAWFLKCRLAYRRNFVRFIIHGLHNYIVLPCEEQLARAPPPHLNEDSSNRQRSSSLGSRAAPRARGGAGGAAGGAAGGGASVAFHMELTETCVDLLARYTTTPCSVKPVRSDTARFLLSGGHSATWLVGHKLVTISTSGCQQNPIAQGLCERCAALCRQHAADAGAPLPAAAPPAALADLLPPPLRPPAADPPPPHLHPPEPANEAVSRQNSSESSRGPDSLVDTLTHFAQRFERITKELEGEEAGWSRVGGVAAGGACPCWCGGWAEVLVRSPAGDLSWLMRLQNQMNDDGSLEWPLQEVCALLQPAAHEAAEEARPPVPAPGAAHGAAPGAAHGAAAGAAPGAAAVHKSSSDSVVAPARSGTQPINIPASPQRRAGAPEDALAALAEGAGRRQPVRRSNSSPEMSSSWKRADEPPPQPPQPPAEHMVLLPACEPAEAGAVKKPPKKADTRVSCEAIPEEISGTSPHHHLLLTFNSDPGAEPAPAPAHHSLQKTASDGVVGGGGAAGGARGGAGGGAQSGAGGGARDDELPPLARSKRSNTISVMSPTRHHRAAAQPTGAAGAAVGGGVTPAFVFLQLYHNMSTAPLRPAGAPAAGGAGERPLLVAGAQHERAIKTLDLVPAVETYCVGVLYVGAGQQASEAAILRNCGGSARYEDFVARLGARVPLDGRERGLFVPLEAGADGAHAVVWRDDVMQVLFHVATNMPTLAHDPAANEKRKHIGNDFVSIVYNDSGAEFDIRTLQGQLNLCIVTVTPLAQQLHRVGVSTKDACIRDQFLPHLQPACVSDASAALLARQLALHCALASQISVSLRPDREPYASNCLERLRLIKRLRRRLEAERAAAAAQAPKPYAPRHTPIVDDFNDYT